MDFTSKTRTSLGNHRRRSGKRCGDDVLKKDSFSDTEADDLRINYQDEMVFVLFDSMLEIIVKEWKPLPNDLGPVCPCKQPIVGEMKECSIGSTIDIVEREYKLSPKRDSVGSAGSLKFGKKDSLKRKLSKISEKSKSSIQLSSEHSKTSIKKNVKVSRGSGESTLVFSEVDWIIGPQDENVKIIFKSGNQYEGSTYKKLMHGYGKYTWSDGTVYEGDFKYGYATGHGILRYPDLTIYHGEFCNSILQGYGELNIALTAMTFCGNWKNGQKHGKGWMLYETEDWYDGEWYEDQRHGKGMRNYKSGEKYQGDWYKDLQHGEGTFVWTNNDVYTGKWKNGKMHGYGEYTWNAFLNQTFTYPIQNIYKGSWASGLRHGTGILDFGFDTGAKLAAVFQSDQKHGAGILVCGNGTVIQQSILFLNDNLVNLLDDASTCDMVTPASTLKGPNSEELYKPNESNTQNKSFLPLKMGDNKSVDTTHKGTQCSNNSSSSAPLRIPIHVPPEDTDFSYYIDLAVQEYTPILFKDQLNVSYLEIKASQANPTNAAAPSITSKQNKSNLNTECQTSLPDYHSLLAMHQMQQQEVEKKNLKDTITTHLPRLYKIYEKYATIATHQKISFKPILIRYFLWQFFRDLKFFGTNNSLIEIDIILIQNPNCGLEFVHAPFEKIYFWQFLQVIMCLTWKFCSASNVTDECKTYGVLATLFLQFLTEVVYTNPKITKSYSLLEFRDLLPIKSVYALYKSIGEPHTVRKFLNTVCVKKHENPPCYLNPWNNDTAPMRAKGINIVPVGGNVIYLEDETLRIGEPPVPNENVTTQDPFKTKLCALRSLGPRRVMKHLISVCPQITKDGVIVNMEYPLSFIEFYDTILMCTFMLVDRKRKRIEGTRMQQDIKLQVSVNQLDVETCSTKQRRSSTKVKKPSKK